MKYLVLILGIFSSVVTGISLASVVVSCIYPTSLKLIGILAVLLASLVMMITVAILSYGNFGKNLSYMAAYSQLICSGYLALNVCKYIILYLLHGKIDVLGIFVLALAIMATILLRSYIIQLNKFRNK